MYTRCPACEALFQMSLEELTEAAGVVRCSNCGKTFNSLANLFDHQPEPGDVPMRGQGMPPLLSHRILLQPSLPGLDPDLSPRPEPLPSDIPTAPPALDEPLPQPTPSRRWPAITAVLGAMALAQGLWLMDMPARWAEPGRPTMSNTAAGQSIVLVGRDMHAHPSLNDAVVISAMLRNSAPETIDFPLMELRLFDRSNQLLGVRRLSPEQYLADPTRAADGLAPGVLLPVIVEIAVTGSEPTGFEFRFF